MHKLKQTRNRDLWQQRDASFSPRFRIFVCLFFLVLFVWKTQKNQVEVPSIQDTKAAEIPKGSSESGQDYAAVESVKAVGSQLPLLRYRPNQPRNLSFPFKSYELICWTFFQSLCNARKLLTIEICTLCKLMFVMPATSAVGERSFSTLKRVKTYLRSTTREGRLNHLMLLHVHKELADSIDMVEVANLFVGDKQQRKQLFGKFSKNDLPMKSTCTFASKATQTL